MLGRQADNLHETRIRTFFQQQAVGNHDVTGPEVGGKRAGHTGRDHEPGPSQRLQGAARRLARLRDADPGGHQEKLFVADSALESAQPFAQRRALRDTLAQTAELAPKGIENQDHY